MPKLLEVYQQLHKLEERIFGRFEIEYDKIKMIFLVLNVRISIVLR
jgi:hypothetical protein